MNNQNDENKKKEKLTFENKLFDILIFSTVVILPITVATILFYFSN